LKAHGIKSEILFYQSKVDARNMKNETIAMLPLVALEASSREPMYAGSIIGVKLSWLCG